MISIIIPSYNRPAVLGGILASLINQSVFKNHPCEILVSVDESDPAFALYRDYITQFSKIYNDIHYNVTVRMLTNPTTGLILAKNNAVEKSSYEYIMMLDDDLILEPGYIEALFEDMRSHKNIGANSGFIVTYKPAISHTQPSTQLTEVPKIRHLQTLKTSRNKQKWRSIFGEKEQVMDWSVINKHLDTSTRFTMDYFVNSYMFRKSVFTQIGGYNPDLNSLTSAHEEVEFTYKIQKAGYTLEFNPFIRMWHWTIGQGGIYKGKDYKESKEILEREYSESLSIFLESIVEETAR